jgi:hypothetical protein
VIELLFEQFERVGTIQAVLRYTYCMSLRNLRVGIHLRVR